MQFNWKVRIANKTFWITVIPAAILLVQAVATLCGFTIDLSTLQGKLIAVVDAVFVLLSALGIVVDPTTAGVGDSDRAMTYKTPWKDEPDEEE